MRHRGARFLAALLVAASGVVALAPTGVATAAAGRCSVRVRERVAVNAPTERIRARLASDCQDAAVTYASWNVMHRLYGLQDVYIFDGRRRTDLWRFQDWQYKGTFRIEPSIAYDAGFGGIRQNRATVEVRYASRVSLASRRAGKVVTLRGHATRYSSATSRFGPMHSRRMFIAARGCRTCAWHRISTAVTGRFGKVFLRVRATRVRDYRAVMPGTASVWGRTSRTTRR